MSIVPAQRFYWLLVLVGAIATGLTALLPPATEPAVSLWMLVGLDGGLMLLAIADGLQARSRRVQVTRQPLERLSVGRDNAVTLIVQPPANTRLLDAFHLQLHDTYPTAIAGSPMPIRTVVSGADSQKLTYNVRPDRRGELTWGAIHVWQRGPWKLAWHRWTVPQPQTVAVYPDLLGLRSLSVRLALQSTGSIRQARRLNAGTEFAELRDYATGDDPRLIDWKATARRGQPLVRVLEPEQEQTLIVLLDRGRLMTAQVEGLSRFDWGLNATLSLALAGLHRGDRVGIGVFDTQMHLWMPPQRGQQYLIHLIERLTPIQPVLVESDYLNAVSTLVAQQHRRALVVLVTEVVDATASMELLSALARLRPRYLPLCVTLRDPYIQERADTPTTEIQTAYARAVALDLLAQRQVACAQLRQKGVMVLDAPADSISELLVEQYLRIKAKSQL